MYTRKDRSLIILVLVMIVLISRPCVYSHGFTGASTYCLHLCPPSPPSGLDTVLARRPLSNTCWRRSRPRPFSHRNRQKGGRHEDFTHHDQPKSQRHPLSLRRRQGQQDGRGPHVHQVGPECHRPDDFCASRTNRGQRNLRRQLMTRQVLPGKYHKALLRNLPQQKGPGSKSNPSCRHQLCYQR